MFALSTAAAPFSGHERCQELITVLGLADLFESAEDPPLDVAPFQASRASYGHSFAYVIDPLQAIFQSLLDQSPALPSMQNTGVSVDDREELLLSCRYGDLDDVQLFVERFTAAALQDVRDDNGNTVLHMACANGHIGELAPVLRNLRSDPRKIATEILEYLLPVISPSLLSAQNASGSTALHWAALNAQLAAARKLVEFCGGPGIDLIDIKNNAGRSPLGEAEIAGWEEGAKWMVEVMRLDEAGKIADEGEAVDPSADIEVEIEDAEGQIARMSLGNPKPPAQASPPS
ncbi:ankyrin [Artomyces pyxidatus]|uniref:Ankyrin n=1 Tax=Artomyces pyxidatus TaxID=48021 RepID=A0ACB8T0D1_9AGAM|nr:ankyrin [Artomyces pyxidatus]